MVHFTDFPMEIIDTVLEDLDPVSLASTAIVTPSLQYPSEWFMYRTVKLRICYKSPEMEITFDAQQAFLRAVSSSERRARYIELLALQYFICDSTEDMDAIFQDLERAMKLMVNLKKLSMVGAPYIQHARLESATFSLTHLSIKPVSATDEPIPTDILLPILKAHPKLRWLSLRGIWLLQDDEVAAIEEQESDELAGDHPSAVVCPGLEYVDSIREEVVQSFVVGRRIKHLVVYRTTEEAGRRWGTPSMLPAYSCLTTLVLFTTLHDWASDNPFPIEMARQLTSLTRLNITAEIAGENRPIAFVYTPGSPLLLSIAQIHTLESLTLWSNPSWCNSGSEEEEIIRFLYESCGNLKEVFVKRSNDAKSHSHYGVGGRLIGLVGRAVAIKMDMEPIMLFIRD